MKEQGIVWTDTFEMEYCKFGNGDKTFVIIPGLNLQSVMKLKSAVEEGYKLMNDEFSTYLFDRKMAIGDDYTIYDMADDTAEAMKILGLKDVYLFGTSQGGMIAQVIAIRHPELVKKLILGSTSSHVKYDQLKVINKWIALAEKKDRQKLCRSFGKDVYPDAVYEQFKSYFDDMSKTVTDEELDKFTKLAKSIRNFNITDDLKKIDCPVLAIGVFEDPVLDDDATMEIAENLDYRPDFSLYMYKNEFGHAAYDTAPDYRQRIYDFMMAS